MAKSKVGGYMKPIYLDNAASTKVNPYVLAKFIESAEMYGNPSSKHAEGYMAKECIDSVRTNIAQKIHCDKDDIFFTMGATMSNQLLIQGFMAKNPNGLFITTSVEHNDIMMLVEDSSYCIYILGVNKDGIIDINKLESIIQAHIDTPILVSIQMANSETGIIQPIHQICKIINKYNNVFLHMDATQYIPYYPINMDCWNIDSISMSGQKIGGIKGSGLLVVRQMLLQNIKPIIYGEQGLIGGTPSTPLIASLGEAFNEIDYSHISSMFDKRNYFLSCMEDMGGILVGTKTNRLPNNIYIRFPEVNGLTLMDLLNSRDIYIGTGSACSTDSDIPSHVAKAYGLSDKEAVECVRFTLNNDITYEEMEYVVTTIKSLLELL